MYALAISYVILWFEWRKHFSYSFEIYFRISHIKLTRLDFKTNVNIARTHSFRLIPWCTDIDIRNSIFCLSLAQVFNLVNMRFRCHWTMDARDQLEINARFISVFIQCEAIYRIESGRISRKVNKVTRTRNKGAACRTFNLWMIYLKQQRAKNKIIIIIGPWRLQTGI